MSIEAIIILVIAMVLLGLGLTFVKDFFGKGQNSLENVFDPLKEKCYVSKDLPLLPTELSLAPGQDDEAGKICIYNNAGTVAYQAMPVITECIFPDGESISLSEGAESFPVRIITLGHKIGRNEQLGLNVRIDTTAAVDADGNDITGTYLCKLEVWGANADDGTLGSETAGQQVVIGPTQLRIAME